MKRGQLVVVDGSNLATEGRASPSLRQLDEAVRSFLDENPDSEVVVVVDATFEHRIAPGERAQFKQAELAGEVVTPPSGVVGRGDAFILKIAQRANAIVLSNDSFQEFHAEHPWLFEEGRLVGGKPVPRVGWIFTPRNPVRGLKSKVATTKAARAAKAARTPAVTADAPAPAPAPRQRASAKKAARVADAEASRQPSKRAAKAAPAKAAAKRAPAKRSRGTAQEGRKEATKASGSKPKGAKATPAKAPAAKGRVEPVNTSRSFLRLVTDHPLGGTVEGEVVQFTSHGAMVSVPVGRTMHVVCYAPLGGLGSPPPTRARDVLTKGETYPFTIVSFDTTRRRAELALTTR